MIQKFKDRDWILFVSHTLCEGNGVADLLAKRGALGLSSFMSITDPPQDVLPSLLARWVGFLPPCCHVLFYGSMIMVLSHVAWCVVE
ncbi:hypothetical protein JHK82_055630 [Glycine max]|nr:hypothetical protein JHK82_055630 [Glycine max]